MISPAQIIDLSKLYQQTFGSKPYVVGKDGEVSIDPGTSYQITGGTPMISTGGKVMSAQGSTLAQQYLGTEIWLPTTIYIVPLFSMFLPYSVIKISGKKTIIRTPLANRIGTVKEQYNIDDYRIAIKGFLIGDPKVKDSFPEDQIANLRTLYEAQLAVTIDNALTNIFLKNAALAPAEQRRVVITDLEFPEVQGGRKNVRPFIIEMESDSVFTLELAS